MKQYSRTSALHRQPGALEKYPVGTLGYVMMRLGLTLTEVSSSGDLHHTAVMRRMHRLEQAHIIQRDVKKWRAVMEYLNECAFEQGEPLVVRVADGRMFFQDQVPSGLGPEKVMTALQLATEALDLEWARTYPHLNRLGVTAHVWTAAC